MLGEQELQVQVGEDKLQQQESVRDSSGHWQDYLECGGTEEAVGARAGASGAEAKLGRQTGLQVLQCGDWQRLEGG